MVLALFWLCAFAAIWCPIRIAVYIFLISISFGTFAVIPLDVTKGVSFVPVIIISPIIVVRLMYKSAPADLQDATLNWRHLGLLAFFCLYALTLTVVAPRIFGGAPTIGLNTQQETPLAPGFGNVTQTLYLLNSCLLALGTYLLLLQQSGREIFRKGLILGGMAIVLSGVADMLTYGSTILDPLRTAPYALLGNADMAGMRRVIGLQPEASSFGYATLSFAATLLFARPAQTLSAGWQVLAALTGWSCLFMAALSTSSGAIMGICLLFAILAGDTVVLAVAGRTALDQRILRSNVLVLAGLAVGLGLMVTVLPDVGSQLLRIFDAAILQKSGSSSYEERSYWNSVSLDGLKATGGFGLGIGSTRASSWIVAILCATGLIGSLLLALFILNAFRQPLAHLDPADRLFVRGTRRALVIAFLPLVGSAPSADFGVQIAMMFAVMTAIPAALAGHPSGRKPLPGLRHAVARPRAHRSIGA
ncbi:hypothetical protein [Sphingomonas sp. TREG-RG-20F-R18-01]|uniref:hypothetical protein n=1 Tax=Sphingomonas sp. TREG-RG-20F-R18-01 TaxID=2914982 RepID=UPI001F5784CC|nr:hypothetical protein [Sphingomonas sp. TREG-RG-20F-R18-01]